MNLFDARQPFRGKSQDEMEKEGLLYDEQAGGSRQSP